MKRGFYLWDWFGTKTIVFRTDMDFHDMDFARKQDCFPRFNEAKKRGISDIKRRIAILEQQLRELERTTLQDVRQDVRSK